MGGTANTPAAICSWPTKNVRSYQREQCRYFTT